MSELGELLELLYGARDRFRTARLVLRHWRDERLADGAFRRQVPEAADGPRVLGVSLSPLGEGGDFPDETEGEIRVWVAGPKRYRAESSDAFGEHVSVRDGRTRRSVDDSFGPLEQDAEGMTESWEHLVDPAPLLGALRLEPRGEARCAGRDAVRVTGTPRSRHQRALHVLGFFGADVLELLADARLGVVLRAEARSNGAAFATWEVLEADFDQPVPAELLELQPPTGEQFRSPREIDPSERLTIEEAVARASFTVWMPPSPAGQWKLQPLYTPAGGRRPETLTLLYFREDATHHLVVQESSEPIAWDAHAEPEAVEHGGRRLRIVRPSERHRSALVLDEREGTQIALQSSDLAPEQLLDLGASLVPASTLVE